MTYRYREIAVPRIFHFLVALEPVSEKFGIEISLGTSIKNETLILVAKIQDSEYL